MYLTLRQNCFKLNTFVYMMGLVMMVMYFVVGLGVVAWFVISNQEHTKTVMKLQDISTTNLYTMNRSLVVLGIVLVISLLGLVTCLVLVLGVMLWA